MKLLAILTVLISSSLCAQWVQLPPLTDFSIVRSFLSDGTTLYAATDGEGIFKTTDNGQTWTSVNTGLDTLMIQSLTGSGNSIFAGTGNGKVFQSTNQGATWVATNGEFTPMPVSVLLNGPTLLAGSVGVSLSSNMGMTWSPSLGIQSAIVSSLAVNGSTVYATIFNGGVARSTDGGLTWATANTGLNDLSTISFGVNGSSTFVSGAYFGIFKTTDDGATWATANGGIDLGNRPAFFASAGSIIYLGGEKVLYLSTDDGTTWKAVDGLPETLSVNAIAAHNGMLFVQDGYTTWRRPLSELSDVAPDQEIHQRITCTPNPTTAHATISFTLANPAATVLTIIDPLGRIVTILEASTLTAGSYQRTWDASNAPSGVYYYQLRRNGASEAGPVVISH